MVCRYTQCNSESSCSTGSTDSLRHCRRTAAQGQVKAARTLRTLATNKDLVDPIMAAGLQALASLLQTCMLCDGRIYAAYTLANLTNDSNCQLISDAALPGMLALAQVHRDAQRHSHVSASGTWTSWSVIVLYCAGQLKSRWPGISGIRPCLPGMESPSHALCRGSPANTCLLDQGL